jgi:hypothetical protein
MTFDHPSVNEFFGFPKNHVMPYICIDNPLVYTNKAKDLLKKSNQNAAWDLDTLKSLMLKFESSAEEL